MNSIYMILLAIYLFRLAVNLNNKIEKAQMYKGVLAFASLLCFFGSVIIHVCEAI